LPVIQAQGISAKDVKIKKNLNQLAPGSYVQTSENSRSKKELTGLSLGEAIEQGLRKNYEQIQRKHNQTVLDLGWDDTKEDFLFPQLALTMTTGNQRIARLKSGQQSNGTSTQIPDGSISLGFSDYTLFNWGKDYLSYLNNRDNYLKGTRNLKEERRELKHDIIIRYFQLVHFQNIYNNRKNQLRHASFVYRYAREKVTQRKLTKQEYYQTRSLYLKSQNEFQTAKVEWELANEELAFIINDNIGSQYLLKEDILYVKNKVLFQEALRIAKERNSKIQNAENGIRNAKRDYQITVKENLPLPKFSLNLGAYTHSFGQNQNTTTDSTFLGSSNVDVVASINATWSLTGPGGFLNGRKTTASMINKHLAFNELAWKRHLAQSNVEKHFKKIKLYEDQVTILDARTVSTDKTFDSTLQNYLNRKTRFLDFQSTLIDLIESENDISKFKFLHIREKVLMAQTMGLDELPGENFEKLTTPIKRER
jgi:outer membrane protein TolC